MRKVNFSIQAMIYFNPNLPQKSNQSSSILLTSVMS
jgi:hypothetical protein